MSWIILVSAFSALGLTRYNAMPKWYYRYLDFKPFNCTTCSAFWIGAITTFINKYPPYDAVLIGLASIAGAIVVIKLTEK
jgi:hypothetical protein